MYLREHKYGRFPYCLLREFVLASLTGYLCVRGASIFCFAPFIVSLVNCLLKDLPLRSEDISKNSVDLKITKDAIQVMIDACYFLEAKLPLEIFHSINTLFTSALPPIYLDLAIAGFCGDAENEGLLRRIEDPTRGYRYEEC